MNRKNMVRIIFWVLFAFLLTSCETEEQEKQSIDVTKILVRVAEIEVYPQYFDQYCAILKEESRLSMEKETGVISIFPLFEKKKPNQIRILEIYADQSAYEKHLLTPHFQFYKSSTVPMVKSLKLIDMDIIDKESIADIFKKFN